MTRKIIVVVASCLPTSLAIAGIAAVSAQAQPIPVPIVPRPISPPEPTPAPSLPPQDPDLNVAPEVIPTVPQPEIDVVFQVSRFEYQGSTVFDQAQLDAITAPYLNKPITFRELQQIRTAISDFYVQRGFVTSGAFIPPQTLRNGVATIQIIEGKLERVEVQGDDRLANYVRSRLARAASPIVNREKLLEALRLLQSDPLVRTVSADLAVGSRVGLSVLNVSISPNPSTRASIELNNRRSPTVGSFERRLDISQANLLGLGDTLAIAYANTNGSNAISLNYTVPTSTNNATLSFGYSAQFARIIEPPFDALDIRSDSKVYELSYRQPIFRRATDRAISELAIGVGLARLESETSILGIRQALTPGANANGQTRISELRLFQEFLRSSDQQFLQLRSQFSFGIDAFGTTRNPSSPDSRFFAWRGQVRYLQKLGPRPYLLSRFDIQLADRPLVPLEQFQPTVRGYRQDAALGDNGIFGSIELHLPVATTPQTELQLVPFFDIAHLWNGTIDSTTLASLGLGLQVTSGNFSAQIGYGIALSDRVRVGNSIQENGFTGAIRFTSSF